MKKLENTTTMIQLKRKMANLISSLRMTGGYIFYEAKFWKDPVTESMVQNEIRQVTQTGLNCYKYGFFSRSGFLCDQEENQILIELKELYT